MTIASTIGRNDFGPSISGQTVFAISYEFKATTDLAIYTFNTVTESQAKLTSGFSIAGTPKADGTGFSSGTMTLTVGIADDDTTVTIINEATNTQGQSFTEGGPFPAKNAEGAYDRLALLVQQVDELIRRAALLRTTNSSDAVVMPDPGADGTFLGWSGGALVNLAGTATTGGSSTVSVSANDTTPGFLNGKLVGGTNMTLVEGNDGGDETLTLDASVPAGSTASPQQSVESGEAAAIFEAFRDDGTPTNDDPIGQLDAAGRNQAATKTIYARILASIIDIATGLEDGKWDFQTMIDGTLATRMTLQQGLVIGSPTGGDQGTGSLNAETLLIDGLPFESSAITPQLTAITTNGKALDTMTTGRQFPAFGATTNLLHLLGGEDSGSTLLADVEILNPAAAPASQWSTGTSAGTAFTEAAFATDANVIYSFGGRDAGGVTALVRSYTPGTDTWDETLNAASPWTSRKKATAVVVASGTAIFVMGGILTNPGGANATDQVRVYNPTGNSWTNGIDLPAARQGGVAAILGDNKLYYFGGSTDNTTDEGQSTIFVYDATLNQWETAGISMPYPVTHAMLTVISGYAVIVGGITPSGGVVTDVWLFDPYDQTFTRLGTLATERGAAAIGLDVNNDLAIAGGFVAAAVDTALLYAGSSSQLSQGVGFRAMVLPTDGLLLNVTAALAGRDVTVRLGDNWRILPFSESIIVRDVAFVGDSVLDGNLMRTASFDVNLLEMVDGASGDVIWQWDRTNNIFYTNGAPVDEIRTE